MTTRDQLHVRLQAEGRLTPLSAGADPLARWQVLGSAYQGSVPVSFVCADIAGECWVALVPTVWLAQRDTVVLLTRQTDPQQAPLTGWAHFC